MEANLGLFVITVVFSANYLFPGGCDVGVCQRFSHNSGGTEIIRCNAIC